MRLPRRLRPGGLCSAGASLEAACEPGTTAQERKAMLKSACAWQCSRKRRSATLWGALALAARAAHRPPTAALFGFAPLPALAAPCDGFTFFTSRGICAFRALIDRMEAVLLQTPLSRHPTAAGGGGRWRPSHPPSSQASAGSSRSRGQACLCPPCLQACVRHAALQKCTCAWQPAGGSCSTTALRRAVHPLAARRCRPRPSNQHAPSPCRRRSRACRAAPPRWRPPGRCC